MSEAISKSTKAAEEAVARLRVRWNAEREQQESNQRVNAPYGIVGEYVQFDCKCNNDSHAN